MTASPGGTDLRAGHLTVVCVISGTLSIARPIPAAPSVLHDIAWQKEGGEDDEVGGQGGAKAV